jgi:hypothetical protein
MNIEKLRTETQDKPNMTKESQMLFERYKLKKNLSKNIIERF